MNIQPNKYIKLCLIFIVCILKLSTVFADINNCSNLDNIKKYTDSCKTNKSDGSTVKKSTFFNKLAGTARDDFLLYTGMWSWHPETLYEKHNYNNNNQGLAIVYKGYMASRFKNSFHDTSYMVGIQRDWYKNKPYQDLEFTAGYRLGLIYGYKKGTTPMADFSKILPLPGLTARAIYNHIGIEAAINAYVISGTFVFSF